MRGDSFFNPDSGENALSALLSYVELVFNTLQEGQGIRFIGNDSHTTMSLSGVHICPSCTREMNWRRDLRSFFLFTEANAAVELSRISHPRARF